MITCSCGKKIDNVPDWLAQVNVQFVCNNCPNRNVRSIAEIDAEEILRPKNQVGAIESDAEEDKDQD